MKNNPHIIQKTIWAFVSLGMVSAPVLAQVTPEISEYQNGRPVWKVGSSFQDVPPELQKIGDAECQKANYSRAIGYSKTGENPDGKQFEKGAFLCDSLPKSKE